MFICLNEGITLFTLLHLFKARLHAECAAEVVCIFCFVNYRQKQQCDKYPNMPSLGGVRLYISPTLFMTGSSGSLSENRQRGPLHTHF